MLKRSLLARRERGGGHCPATRARCAYRAGGDHSSLQDAVTQLCRRRSLIFALKRRGDFRRERGVEIVGDPDSAFPSSGRSLARLPGDGDETGLGLVAFGNDEFFSVGGALHQIGEVCLGIVKLYYLGHIDQDNPLSFIVKLTSTSCPRFSANCIRSVPPRTGSVRGSMAPYVSAAR